jgi:hypothetical protein
MNIIYSKYKQANIKEEKANLMLDVPGTFKEESKLSFIELTFLIFFLWFCCKLINLCPLWNSFNNAIIIKEGTAIRILASNIICIFVYGVFLGLIIFSVGVLLFIFAEYVKSHIKTPCMQKNKENRKKWEKLDRIDKLLDLQNEINDFIETANKVNFVFEESESKLEITIERNGCYIKKDFIINKELGKNIIEKDLLDFSYLDK